jgi:hypothetical protein
VSMTHLGVWHGLAREQHSAPEPPSSPHVGYRDALQPAIANRDVS